jgi:hypothetical protein
MMHYANIWLRRTIPVIVVMFITACAGSVDGPLDVSSRALPDLSDEISFDLYAQLKKTSNGYTFGEFSMKDRPNIADVNLRTLKPAFRKVFRDDCTFGTSIGRELTKLGGSEVDDNRCIREGDFFVAIRGSGKKAFSQAMFSIYSMGLFAGQGVGDARFDQRAFDRAVMQAMNSAGGVEEVRYRLSAIQAELDEMVEIGSEVESLAHERIAESRQAFAEADIHVSVDDQVGLNWAELSDYFSQFVELDPQRAPFPRPSVNSILASDLRGVESAIAAEAEEFLEHPRVQRTISDAGYEKLAIACSADAVTNMLEVTFDCPEYFDTETVSENGIKVGVVVHHVILERPTPRRFFVVGESFSAQLQGNRLKIVNASDEFADLEQVSIYVGDRISTKSFDSPRSLPPGSSTHIGVSRLLRDASRGVTKLADKWGSDDLARRVSFGIGVRIASSESSGQITLYDTKRFTGRDLVRERLSL